MASAVIGSLRVNLGIDSAQFSGGLKQANSGLQKFGRLAKTGLIAVGAAAATAAAGMGVMVKNTINSADEMSKAAKKFGVPIEELSRLKYAADLSGVSFGSLGTGLRTLSKNMLDASNGTGEAKDAFESLGIAVTNSDGSLKGSTQILGEISDEFNKLPDGAEKTALAMKLMGRSGAEMIPLLAGGSEALGKLTGEADKFGQVFTQDMGSSAEAFNDNMSRLSGAFGNIAARIAQELLPHLEKFSAWLVENAPAITTFVVQAVEAFAQFGSAIGTTVTFFDDLDASIRRFGDSLRSGIDAIGQFAAELLSAFTALPGQMYEIGTQIMTGLWNGLKSQFTAVKDSVVGYASGLVDSVKGTLGIQSPSTVMHEIGVNIMQGLSNGMDSMASSVKDVASGTAGGIEGIFSSIGTGIADAIKGTKEWKDVLIDALSQLAKFAFSQIGGLFGGGGFLGSLLGGLVGFANGGSFQVGGGGGIDSQLVAFRASPNETVSIHKPGQDTGGTYRISVASDIDNSGNIAPFVTRVAREESAKSTGRLSRTMDSRIDSRTEERDVRRIRPRSPF